MNLQRGQSVPPAQIRPGDGAVGQPIPMGSSFATGSEDRPFLRLNLLRALQLHRRLALWIALGGLALAVAYVAMTWPVYTAQSQIYVQPVQSKVMAQGDDQGWLNNSTAYDSFIQQQLQNVSNPEVLVSALHKLGPDAWQRAGESEQAAAERLGRSIEVARIGTSYEVAITARAADPELAAQIANAVAASVVERASGQGNAGNVQRIAVLREERDRIQNELNADYAEQDELNKQLGMAAVGTAAPDLIDDDISKTREELIKAQTDHDQAEARFTAMEAGKGNSSTAIDAEADDIISADAGLTSMKTSLNQRRAVLITQMANLTPNNPVYKEDAAELAKINGSLDSMMKELRANAATRIQEKLRTDLERTAGVEAQLNGQLRQLAKTAASATPKLQRVNDLATDIVRLRTRYTSVDEQLHNLMLEDSVPGAVHLSVAAVPPLHPTISGILKKALPLALGGLLLGLLAASIANHLDTKVYIASDIEHVLGFAPMAVLPDFDEVSDEVAAEHLLRLSASIEQARKQGSLKSCIFTGAAAGTGVTTVATRVRDVLEAMGRPTLLLDASRTPPPAPRASSTANGANSASDQPATQRGSRSTALLRQVAVETETRQDSLVLTDAAPLTISAETEYLARFADSAIVVIESGVTTRAQVLAAVNTLQRLDVPAVGFVLNRVGLAKADPAFRQSVRDIEKHLRAQGLSNSRRTARSHIIADEPAPEFEKMASEAAVRAHLAPVEPEPAAAQLQAAVPAEPPLPKPVISDEADVPWWLMDVKPKPVTELWQPMKPREHVQTATAAPEFQPQTHPVPIWADDSVELDEFRHEVSPKEVVQLAQEENPYEAESRLNGLRGLLFSLGLKNLGHTRESAPEDEKTLLPLESEQESTVLARSFTPFAEPLPVAVAPARADATIAPAKQVTAEPEFLPPREYVPLKDTDQEQETGSTARGDRRDAYDDDVQILPSRRGQYKRRG